MVEASVAVIGGSGLYDFDALTDLKEVKPDTPFGQPSDTITIGTLEGVKVAFLPRHGRAAAFLRAAARDHAHRPPRLSRCGRCALADKHTPLHPSLHGAHLDGRPRRPVLDLACGR